jgi:hypothetical protein
MDKKRQWFDLLRTKRGRLAEQLKDPAAAGLWKSVIDKYSDNAHFVYELLQNSDDAQATSVAIHFFDDAVEFRHNGKIRLSISDPELEGKEDKSQWGHINSLTAIGASNKLSEQQIGKFGIGFKSVFKYVETPVVEDDEYCFAIHDYIVPFACASRCRYRKKGETAFFLPLKEPEKDVPVVKEKLLSLHNSLLFLPHLKKIEVFEEGGVIKKYQKEAVEIWRYEDLQCAKVRLSSVLNDEGETEESHFFLFERECYGANTKHRLGVAMKLAEDGSFEKLEDEPLYCFFPTQENYHLPYLLNAPFLLAESRETLRQNEQWNDSLFSEVGALVVDSVEALLSSDFQKEILSLDFFSLFPLRPKIGKVKSGYWETHWQSIGERLKKSLLFRSFEGERKCGDEIILAEDRFWVENFSAEEWKMMFPELSASRLSPQYYNKKNELPDSLKLLSGEYGFCPHLISTETFLLRLTASILENHPLEWFVDFYRTLKGKKTLYPLMRNCPIILCQDMRCRTALEVFLSAGAENQYPTVHRALLENEQCMKFFERLDITHPGAWAEISEVIFPAYRNHTISPFEEQKVGRHLEFVFEYYQSLSIFSEEKDQLLSALHDVPMLPAVDKNGVCHLSKISDCYMQTNDLTTLFQDGNDVLFFENQTVEKYILPENRHDFYLFLSAAGLQFGLKLKRYRIEGNAVDLQQFDLHPASLRQSDNGAQEVEDVQFSDLNCNSWNGDKSLSFYHLLSKELQKQSSFLFLNSLYGKYSYVEKGKRHHTEETLYQTTAWRAIFRTPWLLGNDGEWHQPSEIEESAQLSDMYEKEDVDLLFFLNVKKSEEKQYMTKEQKEVVRVWERFKSQGISLSDIEEAVELWKKNANKNV